MDFLQKSLSLARYNVKILLNLNIVTAVALVLLSPLVFSFRFISEADLAKIGELYLSLTGILLFPYFASIEEKYHCGEITYVKRTPFLWVFLLRLFLMIGLNFLLILGVITFAFYQGGEFSFWKITLGVLISALYFGMIGLTVTNLTRNLTAAYLFSFSYFVFEFMTRGKYTKDLFVLSLLKDSFLEKYWILLLVLLMIIGNLLIIYRRR